MKQGLTRLAQDTANQRLTACVRKERIWVSSCLLGVTLSIILIAGLWPFCAPPNRVKWLVDRNGLSFARYGTASTDGLFQQDAGSDESSGTIELWLSPKTVSGTHTILAFDSSLHPGAPLSIVQAGQTFRVVRYNGDRENQWTAFIEAQNAFHGHSNTFFTVVLRAHKTSIYVDGVAAQISLLAGDSIQNLTGRLVLAASPHAGNSWDGAILGLAIYQSELTAEQVARDYSSWTHGEKPALDPAKHEIALYIFDEHSGRIAHNSLDATTNLRLPERYTVLDHPFLTPAWIPFRFGPPGWDYWEDDLINVAGFIPFGFFLLNFLSLMRPGRALIVLVIAIGFALSFVIETLQWLLPTRDSGMTDLITNTIGTAVGAVLYRSPHLNRVWRQAESCLATVSKCAVGFCRIQDERYPN